MCRKSAPAPAPPSGVTSSSPILTQPAQPTHHHGRPGDRHPRVLPPTAPAACICCSKTAANIRSPTPIPTSTTSKPSPPPPLPMQASGQDDTRHLALQHPRRSPLAHRTPRPCLTLRRLQRGQARTPISDRAQQAFQLSLCLPRPSCSSASRSASLPSAEANPPASSSPSSSSSAITCCRPSA